MGGISQFRRRYHQQGKLADTDSGLKTYTGGLTSTGASILSGSTTDISSATTTLSGTAINLTGTTTTISGAMIASSTISFTGVFTATGSIVNQPITLNTFEGMDSRYRLKWVAGVKGKPGVLGDVISATEGTNVIADKEFHLVGTNVVSTVSSLNVEGGIKLTSTTGGSDQAIIAPHLDASQSAWAVTTWGTDKSVRWECLIKTGGSITANITWAGLKLTNTDVIATDANQVFFRYENGVNSGKWQAVDSIGDSDNAVDSGVTVVLSTQYHLLIIISAARIAKFYIDGVLVSTSAALTDTTDLIPYIGVRGNAQILDVYGQVISRVAG